MRQLLQWLKAIAFLVLAAFVGRAGGAEPPPVIRLPDDSVIAQGQFVFDRNCVVCHGAFGDGRGEMGLKIKPRPRNFSLAVFKFRSTPAGYLPTDDDLARTIRQGLSGSSMPVFQFLSERDLNAVIQYVKTFSTKWNKPSSYAAAMPVPEVPAWFDQTAGRTARAVPGRLAFQRSCAACHGESGDGKGPSAAALVDRWDEPAPVPDLRRPVLRSGPSPRDTFRTLITGLDGTPMPGFRETFTDEQLWQLIAFLEEIQKPATAPVPR